jgi:hypothetical protein
MHDSDLGVAIERSRATDAEHLLAASGALRKPKDSLRRLSRIIPFAATDVSGFRCGLRSVLVDAALGESAPNGFQVIVVGAHSFSVRDQGPAEGARTIFGKASPPPKMALATVQFFGEYRVCQDIDIPRLCRDTGPPLLAGFVFSGFVSPNQARFAPSARVSPFAIRVNARPAAERRRRFRVVPVAKPPDLSTHSDVR